MHKTLLKAAVTAFLLTILPQLIISQSFYHNIDEAKKQAAKDGHPIALVFSGSDWCKPCIQLKTNVLQHQSFIDFADKNLVLVEVDFPYKKANRLPKAQQTHNEKLAEQYNQQGVFPLIVLTDSDGDIKGELGYDKRLSVNNYIQNIEKIIAD